MARVLTPSRETRAFLGFLRARPWRRAATKVTITSRREKRGGCLWIFIRSGPGLRPAETNGNRDGPLSRKNHLLRPSSFDDQSYWRGDVTRVGCASQWRFRMMQQKSSFHFPPRRNVPPLRRSQRAKERERVCVIVILFEEQVLETHCRREFSKQRSKILTSLLTSLLQSCHYI